MLISLFYQPATRRTVTPGAEALSGLARAFFYAGAKSLIVSNWEVNSQSTVALMVGLFAALKSDPHLTHAASRRERWRMATARPLAEIEWRNELRREAGLPLLGIA